MWLLRMIGFNDEKIREVFDRGADLKLGIAALFTSEQSNTE